MTHQQSFTKVEKEVQQSLKKKMMLAESTEDVKKFFYQVVQDLVHNVTEGQVELSPEDLWLDPGAEAGYRLSSELLESPSFRPYWESSDLPNILQRMAELAVHRYIHLDKHPDKTDSKMFPRQT
jgi:hypothetical protein